MAQSEPVASIYKLSTQEVEIGGSGIQDHLLLWSLRLTWDV